jgi:hypothetical protein
MDRGGKITSTGKIGKVKCIRQQLLKPAESIRARLSGEVVMEALREKDALRINAHIAVFMTPVRWLEANWTDYLKEGPSTSTTLGYTSAVPELYGLGGSTARNIQDFWINAPLRVYNEWYKWPEDTDLATWPDADGPAAVNLDHSWTRCRDQQEPASDDDKVVTDTLATGSDLFKVNEIAEIQARYRRATENEILSFDRYQEILSDMFGADGSREVDQVPIKIAEDQVGVNPRSIPAQDAAGLGQFASLYDFDVDFGFNISAPEHCILTYMLTCRFAPIADEVHPLANDRLSWAELVGDPTILSVQQPQDVQIRDCLNSTSSTSLGYLPAGWQHRAKNNIIGSRIDGRNSFPYMEVPTTAAEARDGSRRVEAFRSSSLGDYRINLYAQEDSFSAIPNAESSYYLGVGNAGKGNKSVYPNLGKVK